LTRHPRIDDVSDPADMCIECGKEAPFNCGGCGFPLCSRHHETGGGFCKKHYSVGDVPVCVYRNDIYVGVFPREEFVVLRRDAFEEYHLPDDAESIDAPACDPDRDRRTQKITLAEAFDRDFELCEDCRIEARHRRALFLREVREDFEVATDGGKPPEERQADALEEIVNQLEIQNAALLELAKQQRRLVRVEMQRDPDGFSEEGFAGYLSDNALNIRERVDLDALDRWEER